MSDWCGLENALCGLQTKQVRLLYEIPVAKVAKDKLARFGKRLGCHFWTFFELWCEIYGYCAVDVATINKVVQTERVVLATGDTA